MTTVSLNIRRGLAFSLALLLGVAPLSSAQTPAKFDLTIDNIMRGSEMIGTVPTQIRWSQDSQHVYFDWKQPGEPRDKDPDLYVVNHDGSGLRKLSEADAKNAPPANGEISKDKRWSVFAENGDIFLYDHNQGQRKQLTQTSEAETNPHFTRDQRHVYFSRANNLYVVSLEDGSLVQMTDIRAAGGAGAPAAAAGGGGRNQGAQRQGGDTEQRGTASQEYLKQEEHELFDVIKQRAQKREEQDAKRREREKRKPFQLAARQGVNNLQLSPDGKYVIASVNEQAADAKTTVVPNFVTESAYTEEIPSRTKVGDTQTHIRLAVLTVETGAVSWVDHGQKQQVKSTGATGSATGGASLASSAPASAQPPASLADQPGTASGNDSHQPENAQTQTDARRGRDQGPAERGVAMFSPIWSEDGSKAVLMARAEDNKDRWILSLDPATGKTKVVTSMHDDAWIDGPGANTLGWMPDNEHIYFQSERDGYAHLYTISVDGGEPTQLTSGKFEVFTPQISPDKSKWLFTSSETHPGERNFYTMPLSGGARTRVTNLPGSNEAIASPDGNTLAMISSYTNKPPELYLQENKPGADARQVTTSPTAEWLSYKWIDPPVITFNARDGAAVYARFYRPAKFSKGGPAVIFVHGAGYTQNAHKYWSTYYHEYMFHHFLMEHGYAVMDIDYRGSAGYGRDWRTGIYRHMGGKDLDDQIDAAKWLAANQGVDPKRIGIYGGSYGGFITLMAMFTQPDVFAAGAALRPVSDWANYNHPYTSNILNNPQQDAEAYKQSSPIFFANGLKGALLICHGMVDVNVHFQDTVRLVQKLIELRKENWELAVFPVEDHGFVENSSWADEYKRIFNLFETNLKKK